MEQTTADAFDDVPRTRIHRVWLHHVAPVSPVLGPVAVTAAMAAR